MTTLVTDRRIPVPLQETSDVVAIPGGAFLVVSDIDARAAIVSSAGTTYLDLPGHRRGESSMEAVTWDPASGRLVSFAEDQGELFVHRWDGRPGTQAKLVERRNYRFGKRKNKGVEGIAPYGGRLLCANEGKPRALMVVGDSSEDPIEVVLDPAIGEACEDFSGLAYDAHRKSWLLVSDESASLVELAISDMPTPTARLLGAWELHDERGVKLERVEGVAVDDEGSWWVLLEDEHALCRVRVGSPG